MMKEMRPQGPGCRSEGAKRSFDPRGGMTLNQLQELYQKKYFDKAPEYTFEPWDGDEWNCECVCGGVNGFGRGVDKTKAKKKAAYMVLVRLLKAAGICEEEKKKL